MTDRPRTRRSKPGTYTSSRSLSGTVSHTDGTAISGLSVRAFHRHLEGETDLGETKTAEDGTYTIQYVTPEGETTVNLYVRVLDSMDATLAISDVRVGAKEQETFTLTVSDDRYRGPSSFQRHLDALTPLLGSSEVLNFTSDDVALLVRQTNIASDDVADWIAASRLAKRFPVSHEALFALVKAEKTASPRKLFGLSAARVKSALVEAAKANTVSADIETQADELVKKLRAVAVDFNTSTANTDSLGKVLALCKKATADQQKELVRRRLDHTGPIRDFWQSLRGDDAFGDEVVDDLQLSVQLGAFSQNHPPLAKALRQRMEPRTDARRTSGKATATRSLASTVTALDKEGWKAIIGSEIDGATVGVPDGIAGATDEEKIDNYASLLTLRSKLAFPTAAVALKLSQVPGWESSNLPTFVEKNPSFDLRKTNVSKYLKSGSAVLDPAWDSTKLETELLASQRAMRIAPEATVDTVTTALLGAGYDSAAAVRGKSRTTFIAEMSASLGGDDIANEVYLNAQLQTGRALAAYTMMNPALSGSIFPWLGFKFSDVPTDPTWASLFGSADYCACDDCDSIFGAAAYLVDLLGWLDTHGTTDPKKTVFDLLDARRPDIKNIELSCDNTNVVLPYADLVNEILEVRVLAAQDPPVEAEVPTASEGTSEELLANPAHVQTKVYDDVLSSACFPQILPFDLWSELGRVYFEHLGVARHELMETMETNGSPTAAAIAASRLHLSPALWSILAGTDGRSTWDHWGSTGSTTEIATVSTFLDRAGLDDYDALLDLLHTRFSNPEGLAVTGSACNADERQIDVLTEAGLDRLHRFLRLWRATGWTMLELDKVLYALNGSPAVRAETLLLDETILKRLADLERVRELTNTPLLDAISLWSTIDAFDDRDDLDEPVLSLYETVFLNKAVHAMTGVIEPEPFPFVLNDDHTELRVATHGWDDVVTVSDGTNSAVIDIRSALQAALRVGAEDLSLMVDDTIDGVTNSYRVVASETVTLADLSALYRHVALARALGLTIEELLKVFPLLGLDPFDLTDTDATVNFLETVADVRASGFSLDELHYLLEHDADAETRVGVTDEAIGLLLAELHDGLDKIDNEIVVSADPSGDRTEGYLTMLLDADAVATVMAALADAAGDPTEALTAHLVPLLPDLDVAGIAAATAGEARYDLLQASLVPYLQNSQREALAIQKVSEFTGRDSDATEDLLASRVRMSLGGATVSALVGLTDPSAPFRTATVPDSGEMEPDDDPDAFGALRLLFKMALALTRMSVELDEQTWLFETGTAHGLLDLNTLPTSAQSIASGAWTAWATLVDLFALRDDLPGGEPTLADLLDLLVTTDDHAPSWEEFRGELASRTSWTEDDVDALAGVFGVSFPDGWMDGQALRKLVDAFALIQRIGAPVDQALDWIAHDPTAVHAEQIRLAAKSKHDESAWPAIAKALRDPVRDLQRAALVGYLIQQDEDLEDEEDLYANLLIDVEMTSCMLTSRLKQAISSVQLFVHRAFLNLEEGVTFSRDDRDMWEWMKQYRVWEANRRVFLYPENWLEPELRTTKSPFFEELESTLLQGELTDEAVEGAYLTYLQQLSEVARLEVMGMYHQYEADDDGTVDILHVIARTRSTPHTWWYRQWVDQTEWTPWDKLDIDIDAEHVIVTVHNRRLMVFWPLVVQNADSDSDGNPTYSYDLGLSWSELVDGQWSAKRTSIDAVQVSSSQWDAEEGLIYFRLNQDESLTIECRKYETSNEVNILGTFTMDDCSGELLKSGEEASSDALVRPSDMFVRRMRFKLWGSIGVALRSFRLMTATADDSGKLLDTPEEVEILAQDLGGNTFAYPHQYPEFASQHGVFFDDDDETLFVMPHRVVDYSNLFQVDATDPALVGALSAGTLAAKVTSAGSGPQSDLVWQKPAAIPDAAVFAMRAAAAPTTIDLGSTAIQSAQEILDESIASVALLKVETTSYAISHYRHPYVCDFLKAVRRLGVAGLLDPNPVEESDLVRQQLSSDDDWFVNAYAPTDRVLEPYPTQTVDFDYGGPYADYNWELFFHVPFLIANRLYQDQNFESAREWFHYIFDPTNRTDENDALRFWKIKPFYREPDAPIADFLKLVASDDTSEEAVAAQEEYDAQVAAWLDDPFDPHAIARLRTTAYQKAIVMKYLDNLIAWGDSLFRQDTIETINEATQIYILAYELLGDRPVEVPQLEEPQPTTFAALRDSLSGAALNDPLVKLENELAVTSASSGSVLNGDDPGAWQTFQFCIPENDKLTAYWDTVEDRLFKIRNCMNIEGVVRQLPLFEPPIDPGMLVRARAAGVDLASALSDLNAPLPHYRVGVMLQKAQAFNQTVRSLGSALMSALEKKDAEALANLRAAQEADILEATTEVKKKSVEEAQASYDSAVKGVDIVTQRKTYYEALVSGGWLDSESKQYDDLIDASRLQTMASLTALAAAAVTPIPKVEAAVGMWSGVSTRIVDGQNLGYALQLGQQTLSLGASIKSSDATVQGIKAERKRRNDEWQQQVDAAEKELAQLEKQKEAASVRLALAQKDLEVHLKQVDNAKIVRDFMEDKYTNEDLYGWMAGQLSTLYFQSYQLAYDLAKRAEQAYRHELAIPDASFIQFGYWDSLKKGLLAGDRLQYDLERMDAAYLENNRREYEITRHVSLALLNPDALLRLKTEGKGEFEIPEALFDLDFPGQYLRRVRSVSVTLPCVTGPQTGAPCRLTLLSSRVRHDATVGSGYAESGTDGRFWYYAGAVESIVLSGARDDAGLFAQDLRDERYLPFEGAGAISSWRIELTSAVPTFDWSTITDAVLTLRYTAREGGDTLRDAAKTQLVAALNAAVGGQPLARALAAAAEFPDAWNSFLYPVDGATETSLAADLSISRFPYFASAFSVQITRIQVVALLVEGADVETFDLTIAASGQTGTISMTTAGEAYGGNPAGSLDNLAIAPGDLTLTLSLSGLPALSEWLDDLIVIATYKLS